MTAGSLTSPSPAAPQRALTAQTTCRSPGTRTTALLTDMNQCLADRAGNAVEAREAVQFLTTSNRNPRLEAVTLALCAEFNQAPAVFLRERLPGFDRRVFVVVENEHGERRICVLMYRDNDCRIP